jgi:hypothetical protein
MTSNKRYIALLVVAVVAWTGAFFAPEVQFGNKEIVVSSFGDIKALQDAHFERTGEYLQIVEGKSDGVRTARVDLGTDVPENITVEKYKTPRGEQGFSVREKTKDGIRSVNYGPTSEEWRTYQLTEVSTSTLNFVPFDAFNSLLSFSYPLAYGLTTNTHSASTTRASSQYFSITDAAQTGLDGGASMTFCTWFRLATYNTAGDHHTLVAKGSATGSTRQFRWNVRGDGGGGNTLWVFQASSAGSSFNGDTTVLDSGLLSPMVWYHACVVFDGANTDTLYYRNGAQIGATQNNGIASLFNGSSPFSVGAENVGVTPSEFFNGQIDDLRVWTRVLTPSEIADQYNSPCDDTKIGASNSAQWLFDNDALDVTANNNDLTASGGATFTTDNAYVCASAAPPDWTDQGEVFYYP